MESYRKKIITNVRIGIFIILAALSLCIFDLLISFELISFKPKNILLLNFQTGFLLGIGMVALASMVKYKNVLKNPTRLQTLYNEEHDERMLLIEQKAGMPMLSITSSIMILAGIVAGYFNIIVFYTLIAAGTVQLIFGLIVKIYYRRTI
ncbi:MAG: hypothetical protein K0S47_1138 [Herbinix sp.]|jgi:hypothetical protein|nr:hypothetical protein [Herbinix sp.]